LVSNGSQLAAFNIVVVEYAFERHLATR